MAYKYWTRHNAAGCTALALLTTLVLTEQVPGGLMAPVQIGLSLLLIGLVYGWWRGTQSPGTAPSSDSEGGPIGSPHSLQRQVKTDMAATWLAGALEALPDAVVATDASGAVNFMNSAARTLCECEIRDAAGRPCESVVALLGDKDALALAGPLSEVLAGEHIALRSGLRLCRRWGGCADRRSCCTDPRCGR